MTVGVLVLAAGSSRRFGADKRKAIFESGQTVIERTLANIAAAELPCRVCLGMDDAEMAGYLPGPDADIV